MIGRRRRVSLYTVAAYSNADSALLEQAIDMRACLPERKPHDRAIDGTPEKDLQKIRGRPRRARAELNDVLQARFMMTIDFIDTLAQPNEGQVVSGEDESSLVDIGPECT